MRILRSRVVSFIQPARIFILQGRIRMVQITATGRIMTTTNQITNLMGRGATLLQRLITMQMPTILKTPSVPASNDLNG